VRNNDPIYFGEVIRRLRKSRFLSQQDLAERSSLDLTTISHIERNLSQPGLDTLLAIATALDLEFMELMQEINDHFKYKG
jgi:transcriptional regulator with XRE-family HTH domain